MLKLEVGKSYKIRDGGTIRALSVVSTDTENAVRCVTDNNETVFYDPLGRILPLDGGRELGRYSVVSEVRT